MSPPRTTAAIGQGPLRARGRTPHLPALVTTKNMTLCLIPPSPGRSDPPLSNQMNLGVFPSFDHLVT